MSKEIVKIIDNFFMQYKYSLNFLGLDDHIIKFSGDQSEQILKNYYNTHKNEINAITRVDKSGKIIYTYPENNDVIGLDISKQDYNAYVMENHKGAISEIFKTVQGYYAIAYAVPVFNNKNYEGSITILIRADNISNKFIIDKQNKEIKFNLISEKGNILFGNNSEIIGKNINDLEITESYKNIFKRMLNKESDSVSFDIKTNSHFTKNYGVFESLKIENTFWSILVIASEEVIYHDVQKNTQKLIFAIGILSISIMLILFQIITRNILEKNQIEKENIEKKFEAVFNQSIELIGILGLDGKVLRINDVGLNFINIKAEEVVGKYFWDTIWWSHSDELQEVLRKALKSALKGETTIFDATNIDKNGEIVYLNVSVKPIYDNENDNNIIIIIQGRDITKTKKIEQELRILNEDLEKRVIDRVNEIEKIHIHMMKVENMANLGSLVGGITHEVSTPLGIATTSSSYLLDEIKKLKEMLNNGQLSKTQFIDFLNKTEEISEILSNNLLNTVEIIKSFKQISIDQLSLNSRKFNVNDYMKEILLNLKHEVNKIDSEVIIDCPEKLFLKTIPGLFTQIITNFIMNSIKHGYSSPKRLLVNIKLFLENEKLFLIYTDNGKGIKKENIDKIFNSYFTTKYGNGGSGLGMNIVQEIVEKKLGGTIKCISEENKGVQFILTFEKNKFFDWNETE